jgi:hypothetical protein
MKRIHRIAVMAAGLALLPVCGSLAAGTNPAPEPTPNRESKILVDFETPDKIVAESDPNGEGINRATLNNDVQFVVDGNASLKLDFTDVGAWHDPYFAIDLVEPIDIKDHKVLAMDVYVPEGALNPDGGWFQFSPRLTTTDPADETATMVSYYDNRDLVNGWNRLVWDLREGTDTKISRIAFAGNTDGARPYTGAIFVDNIRVFKGSFHGIQPDEKLIFGFENDADADFFFGPHTYAVNKDKQYVRDGDGSLMVDLSGAEGGWTSDLARADDLGLSLDVSNATAIHLDLFVPEGHQPTGWRQLGLVVIGEGGQIWGAAVGFVPGQWNTLELALTPDQAKMLTNVNGFFLIRNQDSNTPWNGPIYIDNLRAVVPAPPTAGE